MLKRGKSLITILVMLFLVPTVLASDIAIWQGQYFKGTEFQVGTYEFNFTVYDAEIGGGRRATQI